MKILFVSNYFPPYHMGGYEELCAETAEGLIERGHKIGILTSKIHGRIHETVSFPIYRRLKLEISGPPIIISIRTLFNKKTRLDYNLHQIDQTIKEFQPEIIMIWGMWNLSKSIITYFESKKSFIVLYYISDLWPLLSNAVILHWQNPSKKRFLKIPKKIIGNIFINSRHIREYDNVKLGFENTICVSNSVKNILVENALISSKSVVIHNGIKIKNFVQIKNINSESSGSSHIIKLLYAGRISQDKGINTAINAVYLLKNNNLQVTLDVIGTGDKRYINELKSIIKKQDLVEQVHFFGYLPRKEMPKIYSLHDFLLIPSIEHDALPRVMLEGMSCGCIILGSRIGGICEVIEHGKNGFLFEPGNYEELACIILNNYDNYKLLGFIQQESMKTIKLKFSFSRFITEIEEYIERMVLK